jgi:hypothetical protein
MGAVEDVFHRALELAPEARAAFLDQARGVDQSIRQEVGVLRSSGHLWSPRPNNRHSTILGHATGRLLLKRPGYELDMERVIARARQNSCFCEINAGPDRLDLSADNARAAALAGVKIAVSTDVHSTRGFELVRCGIDQARRAGHEQSDVLNCLPWEELSPLPKR